TASRRRSAAAPRRSNATSSPSVSSACRRAEIMDKGVETRFEIAFSDEQAMLLESAVALVQDKSSSRRARELAESASGYDEAAWREMAELGWTGVAIPEQYGGAGLDI